MCRQTGNAAQQPLHGHLQSRGGSLQEALPLPALVAPALAAANAEQTYLRWKAVIHYMPSSSAAAARGPDFAAAKWLQNQMAYRAGAAHVGNDQGAYSTLCCKSLLETSDAGRPDAVQERCNCCVWYECCSACQAHTRTHGPTTNTPLGVCPRLQKTHCRVQALSFLTCLWQ